MVGLLIYFVCVALMVRRADACGIPRKTAFLWSLLGPLGTLYFMKKNPLSKTVAGDAKISTSASKTKSRSTAIIIMIVLFFILVTAISSAMSGSNSNPGPFIFLGILFFVVWFAVTAGLLTTGIAAAGAVVGTVRDSVVKRQATQQKAAPTVPATTQPAPSNNVTTPQSGNNYSSTQNRANDVKSSRTSSEYQSGLIPSREEWSNLTFSGDDCAKAFSRAATFLQSEAAIADINRRLGIKVEQIPAGMVQVGRLDVNGNDPNHPKYSAFDFAPPLGEYLRLKPDKSDLRFRWTLGVFNDEVMGPIPVFFLVTKIESDARCIALVWSLVKERDREQFGLLLENRFAEDATERGAEGGFATIYQTGFIVDGLSGGEDVLAGSYIIPWKLWFTLSMSVFHNAQDQAFSNTAMPWPYPTDMGPDGMFKSPAASSSSTWY